MQLDYLQSFLLLLKFLFLVLVPDNNQDQIEQAIAKSSQVNQAYDALKHNDSRASYLLQLQKQDGGLEQSIHDFEFLQSALELRELLDDATSSEQLQGLRTEVEQWINALIKEFQID